MKTKLDKPKRRPVAENAPKAKLTAAQIDAIIAASAAATTARGKIEALGLDAICEMVREGIFWSEIARRLGVSVGSLFAWYTDPSDPEKIARIIEAKKCSAHMYAQKAAEVLHDEMDADFIPRARALAEQYRWMAKIFNRDTYGDKQEIKVDGKVELTLAQVDERLKALLAQEEAAK